MSLLKVYTSPHALTPGAELSPQERLHIVEKATDVVVHQGNWDMPDSGSIQAAPSGSAVTAGYKVWGPVPYIENIEYFEAGLGDCVRIIDYTNAFGVRTRALIKGLCYVCTDEGKTVERVEMYSGARLSRIA